MNKSGWKALTQAWKETCWRQADEIEILRDAIRPFAEANIVVGEVGDEDRSDWLLVAISRKSDLSSPLVNNGELLTIAHLRAARKAIRG